MRLSAVVRQGAQAAAQVAQWFRLARLIVPTTEQTIVVVRALAERDGLQTSDCIILVAAPEAGRATLPSEVFTAGTIWRDCVVVNPCTGWSPGVLATPPLRRPSRRARQRPAHPSQIAVGVAFRGRSFFVWGQP